MTTVITNNDKLTFTDLTSEIRRTYVFPGGEKVTIEEPKCLYVSQNGHRIADVQDISHYIPRGWIHLFWEAKPGCPLFVF